MSAKKYTIDMTGGSIFRKLLIFVFPLICTYAMQSLFNAVDMVIVGRFCSHEALAAIGVTLNPITLILRVFIGLSTGANAVVAMYCGAKDHIRFHQATHTSMALAIYGGLFFMLGALWAAKPLLVLMNTPEDILQSACVYIWIYFLGIPFLMIFNFGCALLRAVGDAKRPMYYLLYAGFLNVVLNLVFVTVFKMAVAGVAIATTLSNALAAFLILRTLLVSPDMSHIALKKIRIHWKLLKEILWIGVPAAVNSSFFNVANMFIAAALNTFGALAIAGSAAAGSVEGFITLVASAFQQASMTIVAQNFGAQKYTRVVRSCVICLLFSVGFSLVIGWGIYWKGEWMLGLFNKNPDVIDWGMQRISVMLLTYFTACIMDISCGCLRGIGYSMTPAISSLIGACLLRISWVLWIFPLHRTMGMLMSCYPVSWIMVGTFNCIILYILLKKMFRERLGKNRLAMFP